jgi:transposase
VPTEHRLRGLRTQDHLSRLIVSVIRDELDLSAIAGSYRSVLGQPPFEPRMMTAPLLHGYASGIYSSRRIAKAAVERVDFMMIVAGDPPDFRTISEFRKRHLGGERCPSTLAGGRSRHRSRTGAEIRSESGG